MKYDRVLLKISGEVLGGEDGFGADAKPLLALCGQIKKILDSGVQVAIVVGGGNFWRFRDNKELQIPRASSDAIGMMATIMNARLLKEALLQQGIGAHALAAHADFYFAEPYVPARALHLLERGEVVVLGGGTGNPYFTTDSTAALRALELDCDVFLKATKVDGIYSADPNEDPKAEFYEQISYSDVLQKGLGVMDLTAVTLCQENELPVRVFNMQKEGELLRATQGEAVGSLITP